MSATRAASRNLTGLKRASLQCLHKPAAKLQSPQSRALSSMVSTSNRSQPFAAPNPRISTQTLCELRPKQNSLHCSRKFSATSAVAHGHVDPPKPGEELHVTFIDKDGDEHTFEVSNGDNLLDIAQANDLEMEGACGGSCACSTCHVIVEDEEMYDKMNEPDDDENDMLDLAFGLTETSRLGCQVVMSKELDGLRVKLPSMTRNLQASDFSKSNERSD